MLNWMRTIDEDRTLTNTASPVQGQDVLVERIMDEFHAAIRELRCGGMGRLVKSGVSMTNLNVLGLLSRHGEMPMSRLADVLDVSLSNATGLVDRMEERGLVERVRVADDRRIVKVRLSGAGERTLEEAEVLRRDLVEKILGQLNNSQRERLARCLQDLRGAVANLVATEGPETFGHVHTHDLVPSRDDSDRRAGTITQTPHSMGSNS
jgi:DNA-binding MarR family transcriptional regulator